MLINLSEKLQVIKLSYNMFNMWEPDKRNDWIGFTQHNENKNHSEETATNSVYQNHRVMLLTNHNLFSQTVIETISISKCSFSNFFASYSYAIISLVFTVWWKKSLCTKNYLNKNIHKTKDSITCEL